MHLAIPWHLTAQRVALACLSAPHPKHTQSSNSIAEAGKLCSQPPPPTEPTHRSVTTPGERRPHSANSERKCFDSFVNYIYGFLSSGSSSSGIELISFLFFIFNFLALSTISTPLLNTGQLCKCMCEGSKCDLCDLAVPHLPLILS